MSAIYILPPNIKAVFVSKPGANFLCVVSKDFKEGLAIKLYNNLAEYSPGISYILRFEFLGSLCYDTFTVVPGNLDTDLLNLAKTFNNVVLPVFGNPTS